MKTKIIALVLMCVFAISRGQALQTPLSLISTAGGAGQATISGNANTVEWTIGETFTGSGSANGQSITIGEQQGLPKTLGTGMEESIFSQVKVYPNPASGFVKIDNLPNGKKTISLADVAGRAVQTITTEGSFQTVSTANLPAGIYMLTISRDADAKMTFKISITNN